MKKQQALSEEEEKKTQNTCFFECYKDTQWGKNFRQTRGLFGVNDPIPVSQLAASQSTKVCGFPVELKREKKCEECGKLPCLIKARMKCHGSFGCKSPYVATGGIAYFVPKTVVI